MKAKYVNNSLAAKEFDLREIKYAFHDIDGTHSLIRDWPPVMSIVLHYASENGVPDGYDNDDNLKRIIEKPERKNFLRPIRFVSNLRGFLH